MRTLNAWWLCVGMGTIIAVPTALAQDAEEQQNQGESQAEPDNSGTADDPNAPPPAAAAPDVPENAEEPPTATDVQEEEEAPPPAAPEQLAWRNSFFGWTNGLTVNSLAPGAQLSYDPTWVMYFSLTPRWYLTPTTFLWANQQITLELTNTNDGVHNREPLFSDTVIDLRQLVNWEGFVFQGQARIALPLSKGSQAAGRVMQTGLGLTATRVFPDLANLTVSATVGYRRWWATSNVTHTATPYAGNCGQPSPGEVPICSQTGGQSTDRDIVVTGLTLTMVPIGALSINLSGFYFATYGYELAAANVEVSGGEVTITDTSPTHWRAYTYFSLSLGYDVLPWLNMQIGIQNAGNLAPLYNPDGSIRSPFSTDTQVFLSSTVALDGLYGEFIGHDDEATLTPQERQRRRQGLAGMRSSRGSM